MGSKKHFSNYHRRPGTVLADGGNTHMHNLAKAERAMRLPDLAGLSLEFHQQVRSSNPFVILAVDGSFLFEACGVLGCSASTVNSDSCIERGWGAAATNLPLVSQGSSHGKLHSFNFVEV
mgnify:CR=1 FL=1